MVCVCVCVCVYGVCVCVCVCVVCVVCVWCVCMCVCGLCSYDKSRVYTVPYKYESVYFVRLQVMCLRVNICLM